MTFFYEINCHAKFIIQLISMYHAGVIDLTIYDDVQDWKILSI